MQGNEKLFLLFVSIFAAVFIWRVIVIWRKDKKKKQ
jgi:hypothetical protein